MSYLLDIFNKRQPATLADPTANAALVAPGYAQLPVPASNGICHQAGLIRGRQCLLRLTLSE